MTTIVKRLFAVAVAICTTAPAHADGGSAPPPLTAFVHVNVVTMDDPQVLRDRTVLVKDGTIAAIGTALPVPAGAAIVDGGGSAYLSPGLADMHTHSTTKRDMAVYLANGVTTVLNMGDATPEFVGQVRPAIERGRLPGPRVVVAWRVDGSQRYGNVMVTSADEARALVRLAKTNGYAFIKVYNDLSKEAFDAFIDEGRILHVPVVGHGVTSVGILKQLAAGQVLVAHTEEFLYTGFTQPPAAYLNQAPADAEIPAMVRTVRATGAYVTADLNTYATIARQWGKPDVLAAMLAAPTTRYVSPDRRLDWRGEDYVRRHGSLDARLAFLGRFTKALADGGVPLVVGTDAPSIPGIAPGFSVHDDLDRLVAAGLTRRQALAAATRTPGEFLSKYVPGAQPAGVLRVGDRADMILSADNPLDDLGTLRKPLGVMAAGRWHARPELDALLDTVAKQYDSVGAIPANCIGDMDSRRQLGAQIPRDNIL
jgi:imidazolonepropionase-like amidohydrolase